MRTRIVELTVPTAKGVTENQGLSCGYLVVLILPGATPPSGRGICGVHRYLSLDCSDYYHQAGTLPSPIFVLQYRASSRDHI